MSFRSSAAALAAALGFAAPHAAHALVVDFSDGTIHRSDGSTASTSNNGVFYSDVTRYVEGGFQATFGSGWAIVGDYYSSGTGGSVGNDVLHVHWEDALRTITFAKVDGGEFDLTYFDLTSNTVIPGGQSTGEEDAWITASNGARMKLPSSDWGFDQDFYGAAGDGVARLYLGSEFRGITSFTITSSNAYCFGMDNFYIDQAAPPVPEPGSVALMLAGLGVAGLVLRRR